MGRRIRPFPLHLQGVGTKSRASERKKERKKEGRNERKKKEE